MRDPENSPESSEFRYIHGNHSRRAPFAGSQVTPSRCIDLRLLVLQGLGMQGDKALGAAPNGAQGAVAPNQVDGSPVAELLNGSKS